MKRPGLTFLVIVLLFIHVAPLVSEAQQTGKVYRIGVLPFASPLDQVERERFLKALRGLGYVSGQNLILEDRWAGTDRLPALAASQ